MTDEAARLTILIPVDHKAAFQQLCLCNGANPSQVVRTLIAEYLQRHAEDPGEGQAAPSP